MLLAEIPLIAANRTETQEAVCRDAAGPIGSSDLYTCVCVCMCVCVVTIY